MKLYYTGKGVTPPSMSLPVSCNAVACLEDDFYAASIDPGYPGRYAGPPDSWEPPESPNIDELYIWNVEKQEWIQVPDSEEIPFQVEERLLEALDSENSYGD